ncbi:MFS transporter [Streptomyces litchfieldiae]|uniref:MFS transporter n=1 Tax=Streptomyces litchfieldiae TaxID=3075543 RepID=A0ABU2MZ77_9ACTN|nr:MFS transporter [Streptomyces sp. DSM 44938]MDT0346924.1 MFS transporter [Streptomyces sp. DSM 44938]
MSESSVPASEPDPRRWGGLAVLSLALFLVVTGNIALAVAMREVASETGATSSELQWMLDAYPLTMAALLFAFGALGDKIGRRAALLWGMAGFGVFSVLGGLGDSPEHLIAARTGLGIAGALIMPATLGLVRMIFPEEERSRALALWSASAGLGLAFGPMLGGALVEVWGWEAAFYLNVPVVVVLFVAAIPLLPATRDRDTGKLDPLGALLSCLTLGSLVFGFIEGPSKGWTSVEVLGAWALSLIALVLFIVTERRVAEPMVDLNWFSNRHFAAGAGFAVLALTVSIGMIYLITLHAQQFSGQGPLDTGLRLLPAGIGILLAVPVGERIYHRVGARWAIVPGLLLGAAGAYALSTVDLSSTDTPVIVAGVLVGLGTGLAIPSMTDSVMSNAPKERSGVAGGAFDASIEVGASLGIAVFGSVLTSVYASELPDALMAELPPEARDIAEDSLGGATILAQQAPPEVAGQMLEAARSAFIDGMNASSLTIVCLAGLTAVLGLFLIPGRSGHPTPRQTDPEGQPGNGAGMTRAS